MRIDLYSRPNCGQCTASKKWLDREGVQYREARIDADITAWAKEQGITSLPVVVIWDENDRVIDTWGGFRPAKLKEIASKWKTRAILNRNEEN